MKKLEKMKDFGVELIRKKIENHRSELISDQDVKNFISTMLEFFVIAPSEINRNYLFHKLQYLTAKKAERFKEKIKEFLPNIDTTSLSQISALLNTTTEIDDLFRKVRHNLIVGEKTKSYWFLLQSAAEITQTMLRAKAYRSALSTFTKTYPIGDSIGPLVVHEFIFEQKKKQGISPVSHQIFGEFYAQEISYHNRTCVCMRAKGPEINIGHPGMAVKTYFEKNPEFIPTISLIITIDAISRKEGERAGTVAQGLGVALGSGKSENLDKYQIENIALNRNPSISLEAIVCRQSFEEAVSPMIEPIRNAVPIIIRKLKQIIRTQTRENDRIIIIGIGNAIGVPL
jgi:hypothetical protein